MEGNEIGAEKRGFSGIEEFRTFLSQAGLAHDKIPVQLQGF